MDETLARMKTPLERRRAPRYDCDWPLEVEWDGRRAAGAAIVVSMAGLLFSVPLSLPTGAEVQLTACPHRTLELALTARLVHKRRQPDGRFRYGARIEQLSEDEQQRLRSAIQLFTKGWTDPLAPYAAELTSIG